MTAPLADTLVDPVLLALRDCLCLELARTLAGPTCRCMVVHNMSLPVMDGCDCDCADPDTGQPGNGDAWVRLIRLDPDGEFTTPISRSCPLGWQAVIEIGTYRCSPTSEDGRSLVPPQELTNFALLMGSDRAALLRVVACCAALNHRDVSVDFYTPIGPEAGCGGGAVQFRVALPDGPRNC